MAILKPKRGSGLPTGLQQNELAIDILNKRIYLGNTGGTGDIVSSHITDYVTTLNGASGAVTIFGGTGISVISPTGAGKGITLVNQRVLSIDGSTGTISNVARTNTAQTFTALQSFSSGISAAGGTFAALTRFNAGISSAGGTFAALTRFNAGISSAGGTFSGDVTFSALNGRIIANNQLDIRGRGLYLVGNSSSLLVSQSSINLPNNGSSLLMSSGNGIFQLYNSDNTSSIILSSLSFNTSQLLGLDEYASQFRIGPSTDPATNLTYNAYLPADTGTIALTKNVVSSFNGFTGSVTGVTTGTANTFVPLQSFTNGISSAGGTFSTLTRFTAGISASGGITFNSPIISTRLARVTSSVFETKTTDYTFAEEDNGKIFIIDAGSVKTPVILTVPTGLSIGWRVKVISTFATTSVVEAKGALVYGAYGANGSASSFTYQGPIVEVICIASNTYFAG